MSLPTIYQTFSGKHVFVTGGSGFLGKVLLFKLLKEFPDIGSITLLMRGKKGKQPLERLEADVFSSACYDGIKKELGPQEWKRRADKVKVATGDVMLDQLGLDQVDQKFLAENCSIIIHLAATVNFQEKLHLSVQMNVLGTLRVLALARKCVNLEAFIHTSTCYVNYARHGKNLVKEQVYPLPFDPEQMCRLILGLHEKQIPRTSAALLKKYGFPNTYTFTKNLTESLLQKMKGTLPVTIVRPSIVGCSYREPYPGWVDVLTAAGGILLTGGLGITHELHLDQHMIADIVPVDYVVNTLIKAAYKTSLRFKYGVHSVATSSSSTSPSPLIEKNLLRVMQEQAIESAKHSMPESPAFPNQDSNRNNNSKDSLGFAKNAVTGNNSNIGSKMKQSDAASSSSATSDSGNPQQNAKLPFVFHSATSSSLNPLTWSLLRDIITPYFQRHPYPRRIDTAYFVFLKNRAAFETTFFLRRKVPFYAMTAASKIPGVMSENQKKLLAKYARALDRVADLNFQFRPFTTFQWRFDAKNSAKYLDLGLDDKTEAAFCTDLYDLDWTLYAESYAYGLVRYFMKLKDERPDVPIPQKSSDKFQRSML